MLSSLALTSAKLRHSNSVQGSTRFDHCQKKQCDQRVCRLGPKPLDNRQPRDGYAPTRLSTNTFKLPPFIKPKVFRPMAKREILGPKAGKCECYKNPEYYSYHRYSFYDLVNASNVVKACIKCTK